MFTTKFVESVLENHNPSLMAESHEREPD